MFSLEKTLRTLHGWLGLFVMPWIIVIGLTGIYLNHSGSIFKMLPNGSYDEALFDKWPSDAPLDEEAARRIAGGIWPAETISKISDTIYHDREVFSYTKPTGKIIVAKATGHYWLKTRFTRLTFEPDGTRVNKKIYWGRIFRSLHTKGWTTSVLGTWLADIAAGAMVLFGFTGIYMFLSPRLRRRRNKKARLGSHVERSVPQPRRIKVDR